MKPEFLSSALSLFSGNQIIQGKIENPGAKFSFDLSGYLSGVYFIHLVDDSGRTFRVKVVKK